MEDKEALKSRMFTNKENLSEVPKQTLCEQDSALPSIRADQSLKLIFTSDNKSLVRFINGTLKTRHNPETSKVILTGTEFIDGETYDKIIADLKFYINDIEYHIEFQTAYDNTILLRVMEYSFSNELSKVRLALKENPTSKRWVTQLSQPLVIFLEEDTDAPSEYEWEIRVGDQTICGLIPRFKVPVIKVWEHSIETLIENDWFLLLPYILLRYRKPLRKAKKAPEDLVGYKDTFRLISSHIKDLYDKGGITKSTYHTMAYTVNQLADYLWQRYDNTNAEFKEEVESNMKNYIPNLLDIAEQRGEQRGKVEIYFTKLNMSTSEIAKELNITEETVNTYLKELKLI